MTVLSHNKILPVLLVVVVLAFAVRFAELVTGVSALSHAAFAQAKAPTAPTASPQKESEKSEVAASEKDKPASDSKDKASDKAEDSEKKIEWRDASDEEADVPHVKKEMFEDITKRREAVEKGERELATREALLKAGEQEIDRKYQELSQLRTQIEGLLDKQSEAEKARIESLVKIYEGMKPKEAARIFDTLDLDVMVRVVSKMSERKLSPILAAMNPERAKTVTIMLSEDKKLPELPSAN